MAFLLTLVWRDDATRGRKMPLRLASRGRERQSARRDAGHAGLVRRRTRRGSGLPEQHDAIGIRAEMVVLDAPDIGGLGEALGIDEDRRAFKAGRCADRRHHFLEPYRAAPHFTDLERHPPAGP